MERIIPDRYIGAWEFDTEYGEDYFLLAVDDESSKEDLQSAYDYWEIQLGYDIPMSHTRALWKLLQWLEMLIERAQ